MKKLSYFILLLGVLIIGCAYIPYSYGQSAANEISVCDNYSTKHWDKIIFKIIKQEVATKIQQPFNTELDIKVLDNPKQVADIKKKILNFLGLPITSENRAALEIIDIDYTILCTEKKIVLLPDEDKDGDRLLNTWELNGIDINNDNKIDFILYDANPLHKDIYVEVDFMGFHEPRKEVISDVVDSFANSPVSNPDGIDGIDLHVDIDDIIPHENTTNLANLVAIKKTFFGTIAERTGIDDNDIKSKQLVYHYGLFAHSQPGTSSSGRSNGIPSMEFYVTLGAPGWGTDPVTGHTVGSRDQQAGTFMHELGHNLNLHHGGFNDINCKPNYLSVMSYTRQLSSLIGDRPLDYSRSIFNLHEGFLNENHGIGASTPLELKTVYGPSPILFTISGVPIDWNRDGDTLDNPTSADINYFSFIDDCPLSPNQILFSYDDWSSFRYLSIPSGPFLLPTSINSSKIYSSLMENTSTNITNQSAPTEEELTFDNTTTSIPTNIANQSEVIEELTVEDIRQHRMELLAGINYTISSLPNSAFKQPQGAEKLKDSLILHPQNETGSLAILLQSDKLEEAIVQLNELKAKMDSTFGGVAVDDLLTDPQAQQKVIPMIENLIQVLEKQK